MSVTNSKLLRGYLFVIVSAVIYGCMPLMAKFIYADGVNSMTLVFLRNLLALPVLLILALRQQKSLKFTIKALPSMCLIALLGCCVTPTLLFSAYSYIASGTATVFHFIYPAVVVVGGTLFLRERTTVGTLISVAVCIGGICLFYTPGEPLDWRGSLLALASGFTFAAYVLLLPRFQYQEISGFFLTFCLSSISSVVMLIFCVATGQLMLPQTLTGCGLCLLFALTVTAVAVVLFQQGTFLVGSQRASILSTLEPITGVLIGIIVFSEPATFRVVLGSVLVISASILIAVLGMQKTK